MPLVVNPLYAKFNVENVKELQIIVKHVNEELEDPIYCLIAVVKTDGILNQKYN